VKDRWTKYRLEELGSIQTGSTPKTSQSENFGDHIPFIKPADFFKDGTIDYRNEGLSEVGLNQSRLIPAGSTLMVCIGATIGKVGYTDRDVTTNQQINALTPRERVCSKFLYYQMLANEFQKSVLSNASQATLPILNKKKWSQLSVWLPATYAEQKRIVAILDEAFAGIYQAIANTEKNLVNTRELFERSLDAVFSNLSSGAQQRQLSEVLKVQPRNGWSPPAKHHADHGTPVLTLSSVTGFVFEGSKIKYTSAEADQSSHYWVENDDLLITRSNTHELVGHVAIADGIVQPTIYPDLIMKMKVDEEVSLTRFVYYQLRSPSLRDIISNSARGANPTMKKITKQVVQQLPLVVPLIEDQRGAVDVLDRLLTETRNLQSIYAQKLQHVNDLKHSILSKAFSGELIAEETPTEAIATA